MREIDDYKRKISVSPQIEREYRELSRDYDNARAKYQEIRAKQMEAQTAQNLETDRKGERFTLIEPPLMPEKPVSPNRGALLILGIVLSLARSPAASSGCSKGSTRTVRGRKDLVQLLGVPPLAIVPRIVTPVDRRTARRRFRLHRGRRQRVGCCVCCCRRLHIFVRPLDSLWFAVVRKLGI